MSAPAIIGRHRAMLGDERRKRQQPCPAPSAGQEPVDHSWETFSVEPGGPSYSMCWRCRVTRTDRDYQLKKGPGRI